MLRARGANRAGLIFAVAVFAPLLAFAQTRPLTLTDCVDIALGRSPDLRASDFDIKAARETITSVRAGLLPSLSGTLTLQGVSGQPVNNFSLLNTIDLENNGLLTNQSRSGLLGYGSLSLNYNLYKDGSVLGLNDAPAVNIAKAQKTVLTWTKDLKREQIILIVATSFLEAATRAERLRLDTRRVELCEQRLENIQKQAQIGLKLPTDVELAKAQLVSSRQVLQLSKAQDASARLHLAALIGIKSDWLAVSTRLPRAPVLPPTDKLLADAFAKHPGVGVQNAVVDQQLNTYRIARAQTYPQVTLNSNYLYGTDLAGSTDRHLYTGNIVVSVPIFDFGALSANKHAAADRYLSEKIRLEKVTDDIRNAILDAYGSLIVIQALAASYESDQIQADTAFQVARSQSQAGLVPPLAATDAELLLIDKEEALNDERKLVLQQFAAVQYATGGTWTWIR